MGRQREADAPLWEGEERTAATLTGAREEPVNARRFLRGGAPQCTRLPAHSMTANTMATVITTRTAAMSVSNPCMPPASRTNRNAGSPPPQDLLRALAARR